MTAMVDRDCIVGLRRTEEPIRCPWKTGAQLASSSRRSVSLDAISSGRSLSMDRRRALDARCLSPGSLCSGVGAPNYGLDLTDWRFALALMDIF